MSALAHAAYLILALISGYMTYFTCAVLTRAHLFDTLRGSLRSGFCKSDDWIRNCLGVFGFVWAVITALFVWGAVA